MSNTPNFVGISKYRRTQRSKLLRYLFVTIGTTTNYNVTQY